MDIVYFVMHSAIDRYLDSSQFLAINMCVQILYGQMFLFLLKREVPLHIQEWN